MRCVAAWARGRRRGSLHRQARRLASREVCGAWHGVGGCADERLDRGGGETRRWNETRDLKGSCVRVMTTSTYYHLPYLTYLPYVGERKLTANDSAADGFTWSLQRVVWQWTSPSLRPKCEDAAIT